MAAPWCTVLRKFGFLFRGAQALKQGLIKSFLLFDFMLFLSILYHQFIGKVIIAETMHVRDALADEFVGLGFIEERQGIFQRYIGKF